MTTGTTFIDNIGKAINRHQLLEPGQQVIVALSGGADSVALLVSLHYLGYKCIAAHCNFQLRGEESLRDRNHAAHIASQYADDFREIAFDVETYKKTNGVSTEMACRDLRYAWFKQLSCELDGIPVAVAHHSDDNIETVMLNLLRGTGITGLTGMKPRNGIIIRPLLGLSRNDIELFLSAASIPYVTDSSNLISDVKRNRLRNIILPAIRYEFPDADKGFATSISDLRDNSALYEEAIAHLAKDYVTDNVIDVEMMLKGTINTLTLLYEIIKRYGFNHTNASDIIAIATSDKPSSGRRFHSPTHVALFNRGKLHISSSVDYDDSCVCHKIDLSQSHHYSWGLEISTINASDVRFDRNGWSIYLDCSVLDGKPEFLMRRWQKGDRIEPFGMKGSRLVSDIFSDAKLSLDKKHEVWVLTRNDVILWVVGHRTSRHFTIDTRQHGKVIKLTMPED